MSNLPALLAELEQDRTLMEPGRLRQRIEALDQLEALLWTTPPQERLGSNHSASLRERTTAMMSALEAANCEVYQAMRSHIQNRASGTGLLRWVQEARQAGGQSVRGEGYDFLDEVVSGVLQLEEPSALAAAAANDNEMVFYQPTPSRHIFDLIERAAPQAGDVVIDLGSGVGHVPLLVSICTPARSIGVELEQAYVACAQGGASSLRLNNVSFVQQDAREADLSEGTIFYLYTPFTGTILRSVLDRLRREAAGRAIRIGTFGPCTQIVAKEPWLHSSGPLQADQVAIFYSLK